MEETQNTCSWYDPSCALAWIRDELQSFFLWAWEKILSGSATVIEAIPVPDFLQNVGTHSIPPGVSWALAPFQLDVGLIIIVSAYTARFIVRRLPVVG